MRTHRSDPKATGSDKNEQRKKKRKEGRVAKWLVRGVREASGRLIGPDVSPTT